MSRRIIEGTAARVKLPTGGKCLDVGCGSGALAIAVAKRNLQAFVIGIDRWGAEYASFSKALCERNARAEGVRNTAFQQGDATHPDFPDGTFDAVLNNYVYHNVPGDRQQYLPDNLRTLKRAVHAATIACGLIGPRNENAKGRCFSMRIIGVPAGMWLLFAGSFRKQLTETLDYDAVRAREITGKAKREYKRIICGLPEFEKGDRFKMNIVSCAMLGAFLLEMSVKPTVEQAADYFRKAMTTVAMKVFCRMAAKRKFTAKDIEGMKATAAMKLQ